MGSTNIKISVTVTGTGKGISHDPTTGTMIIPNMVMETVSRCMKCWILDALEWIF